MSAVQVFWDTVGKEEIARNEQFLFFPQCFLPFPRTVHHFFIKIKIVVCKPFQFWSVWNLSFGKRLKILIYMFCFFYFYPFHPFHLFYEAVIIIWRATRKKGLSDVCVRCGFRSACAVRTGWSETIFSILCIFSVYSKSTVAQNLMES